MDTDHLSPTPSSPRSARSPSARRVRLAAALLAPVLALSATACSGDGEEPEDTTTTSAAVATTTTTVEAALEQGTQVSVYVPEVGDCFDRRTIEVEGEEDEDIILLLDCELPHQAEVFHVFEVTDDDLASVDTTTSTLPTDDTEDTEDTGSDEGEGVEGHEGGTTTDTSVDSSDGGSGTRQDDGTTTPTVTRSIQGMLEDLARRRCPQRLGDFVGMPYERSELEVSWWIPSQAEWESGTRLIGCTLFDPSSERLAGSQRDARR